MKIQRDNFVENFIEIFNPNIDNVDVDTIVLFFEKLYERKEVNQEALMYFTNSVSLLGQLSDD